MRSTLPSARAFTLLAGLLLAGSLTASARAIANVTADTAAELARRTERWMTDNPSSLPHWPTPDELGRMDEIGRTFTETPPPAVPPREIAEFERMEAVLVRYPFGISLQLIAAMSQETPVVTLVSGASQENTVRTQYTANGVNLANCSFIHASTNSYWTRDYGPLFVQTGGEIAVVDFPYNRPRPLDDDVPIRVSEYMDLDLYGMNLVQTGGNWMSDGYGIAASSDLVVEENPGLTEAQINQRVSDYLGIDTYHTIPDPNNTYIDHIDCWGKFLDVDKVLIREVPTTHTQYDEIEAVAQYFATAQSSWGRPYEVFRVWTPSNQPYTNSLILNGRVFVPITGSSWDDEALAVYQVAMPGFEVLGFTGTWESTDALHCRAKGLADSGLLHIHHLPLAEEIPAWEPTELRAEVTACSGQALLADSMKCWFRIDGGDWNPLSMTTDGGEWSAWLPALQPGQELDYLLQAADASGRFEQHPFVGRADPHRVSAVGVALTAPQVQIQLSGPQLQLFWEAVPGAATYRVEAAGAWGEPFQPVATTAATQWSEPVVQPQQLYRVVAVTN